MAYVTHAGEQRFKSIDDRRALLSDMQLADDTSYQDPNIPTSEEVKHFTMSLQQLSKLVDYLPEDDLKDLLANASTMSPEGAAELFKNFLGESAASLEFISSFNARRQPSNKGPASGTQTLSANNQQSYSPASGGANQSSDLPPRSSRGGRGGKKKANIHTSPAQQVADIFEGQGTPYRKGDNDNAGPSTSSRGGARGGPQGGLGGQTNAQTLAFREPVQRTQTPPANKLPPSAAGRLISDPNPKPASAPSIRSSSPAKRNQPKVHLTGGTPMSSASKNLSELDALIKTLESGSPSTQSNAKRACNCIATRHPLLAAAPNCLSCGKVICVKEGFGPCTFCGNPIISREDKEGMVQELKQERSQEKMALDRAAHKKVEVSRNQSPYLSRASQAPAGPTPAELARSSAAASSGNTRGIEDASMSGMSEAQKAQVHRDRLLNFQAQNAARTTVHDEAADFQTPDVGVSQWVGPMERARLVKQQQKVLREQEWNAKPEWEKRREMVSLDVVNGKVVKTFRTTQAKYERPVDDDEDKENLGEGGMAYDRADQGQGSDARTKNGTFSNNPLLGSLIRPVYTPKGTGEEVVQKKMWRRVQDDYEDNEGIILDGGVYGAGGSVADPDHREGADERAGS